MSSILTSGVVGFVLGICLIVHIATLTAAIGSLYFQKQAYDLNCYYYGQCYGFYIIIPSVLPQESCLSSLRLNCQQRHGSSFLQSWNHIGHNSDHPL
jgi:hypothetical protein